MLPDVACESETIRGAHRAFDTMASMWNTTRALVAALAGALLVTGCSSGDGDATPPSYEQSDSVTATVLPQLAANGEDVESADDAAWVVDATIADVDEGTAVTLVAKGDDGWSEVDEEETDAKGRVSLTSREPGDLHVVVGDAEQALVTKATATRPDSTRRGPPRRRSGAASRGVRLIRGVSPTPRVSANRPRRRPSLR